jgi:hypothetical protein
LNAPNHSDSKDEALAIVDWQFTVAEMYNPLGHAVDTLSLFSEPANAFQP